MVTALTEIGSRTALAVHRLDYGMDVQRASWSISRRGNNLCRFQGVQAGSGSPCILLFNRGISPRVNRPAREADHSPSSSVEVKNQWSSNFTSSYIFYGLHRADFTFSHLKKSAAFKKRQYTAVLTWTVHSNNKRRRDIPYGLNGPYGVCISET
jgi:hypothetical protein